MWGTPYPIVPRWSERYFEMLKTVEPKPQSMFFVTHDNPVMKAITDTWSKRAEAQGIKVAGMEIFPQELKDFTSIILKVRSARPDIVYISSFDNPSVPLVQQLRQQKVRAMDVHHTMMTGALASQVGMKDVEGITGELPWYPGIKGDYSDLAESVLKKANIDMFQTIFTMGRFTAYLVMVQAIEKAGVVDREKVREALYKGTFKAPPGPVTFDETGFPNNGAFTLQMQNGKVVMVWPPDLATGKVTWPSPSWR
jgi:ABC-type branched-subunit amino acid transport system substrate-binding protein